MIELVAQSIGNQDVPGNWVTLTRNAALDALAVVFPVECAGCGFPDRALCAGCRTELLVAPGLSGQPHRQLLADGTVVVSALRYEGCVRSAILAFKEQGRTDVAGPLALTLRGAVDAAVRTAARAPAGAAAASGQSPVELCPIPTSRHAMRRRGYRPVELLLRCAGLLPARVLAVRGATAQQKALGAAEREGNLHGSFRATCPLHGRRFLIVDDIITTGATLTEAARAITAGGGEVVAAATLAFTPLRVPGRALLKAVA